MTRQTVAQARTYVSGIDAKQLEFVRKRIGTVDDRVILTQQQKDEALAALRGAQ